MRDATIINRLTDAAPALPGRHGHNATSTGAIAFAAGNDVPAIASHSGGKEGLRLVCADEVARRPGRIIAAMPSPGTGPPASRVRAPLHDLKRGVAIFLTGENSMQAVGFLLREPAGTDRSGVARRHNRVSAPQHPVACRLWATATVAKRMGRSGYASKDRAKRAARLGADPGALPEARHG